MILVRTNIYKKKERSGRIVWMVRWKDPKTGKWQAAKGGDDEAEAVAYETRVRECLFRGENPIWEGKPEEPRPTVRAVADQLYQSTRFLGGTEEWQDAVRSKIEGQIIPHLGSVVFEDLTEEQIFSFYLKLKAEGRTHTTLHKYHIVMALLGTIYEAGTGRTQNPVRSCRDFRKRFPRQASSRDINFITPQELTLLYAAASKSRNRLLLPLIQFLANTGLRRMEALDLKWTDVDENSGFIHVRDSKNGKARTIPLDVDARLALRGLIKRSDYIFVNEKGERYYRDSFLKPLQGAARQAGINKRVDLHSLRHSYGSNKIRMGWGLKKVSRLLGHSSIEITSKVYTHLLDGDLKVSDDARFAFDNKLESADIDQSEGDTASTMASALAKMLTEKLTESPLGREALLQILQTLPSSDKSRDFQQLPATSSQIQPDFQESAQTAPLATLMLRKSKKRPGVPPAALGVVSDFSLISAISNGGPERVRTSDLRIRSATL